jgi:WD40 repeat protein
MSGLQPKVGLKAENAHADGIWTLAWSGSERVLTGSLDGSIRLWNSRSLASPISATPRENVGINSLVVNDDGNMAIACYQDSYIRFFSIDPNSGVLNETKEMKNELLTAWTLSLSPDDDTYVIGSQAGKVYLSSIKEEKRLHTLKLPTVSGISLNNTMQ